MPDTEIHTAKHPAPASGRRRDAVSEDVVPVELQVLTEMDYATLRSAWQRLYRVYPPKRVARDLLILGVARKMQEQVRGGHSTATRRRLADLANTMGRDGDVTRNRVARLKPGAKLIREWCGEAHTVIVTEDGFEWKGRQWRSLSAIARGITGTHWSGPRFFGLNGKAGQQVDTRAGDA